MHPIAASFDTKRMVCCCTHACQTNTRRAQHCVKHNTACPGQCRLVVACKLPKTVALQGLRRDVKGSSTCIGTHTPADAFAGGPCGTLGGCLQQSQVGKSPEGRDLCRGPGPCCCCTGCRPRLSARKTCRAPAASGLVPYSVWQPHRVALQRCALHKPLCTLSWMQTRTHSPSNLEIMHHRSMNGFACFLIELALVESLAQARLHKHSPVANNRDAAVHCRPGTSCQPVHRGGGGPVPVGASAQCIGLLAQAQAACQHPTWEASIGNSPTCSRPSAADSAWCGAKSAAGLALHCSRGTAYGTAFGTAATP